jgi:hypothetical protein
MTPVQKQALEQAIVADLRNPDLTYLVIAVRNHVGYNLVAGYAQKHRLTRPRGRKPLKEQ